MLSKLSDSLAVTDLQSVSFPEGVNDQVHRIITCGVNDQAVSRIDVDGVTIDSIESRDLDDAIWAERTSNGYCVWVHIADVTEAIPIYSPLDLEALKRTTSIYGKDSVIPMIPRELSNGLLSLDTNGSDTKLTMTLQVDLDLQGVPQDYSFYESKFTNKKRYNYENFGEDFMSPDSENYEHLHLFKEIADKLNTMRSMNSGNINYKEEENIIKYCAKNGKQMTVSKSVCHNIVENFMILGNEITGNHLASIEKGVGIYKLHDHLQERSYSSHLINRIHKGLGVVNYAHFTSPIRRYPDTMNHREVKADVRGEPLVYEKEDRKIYCKHDNNTRYKIDMIDGEGDYQDRSIEIYEKMKNKMGAEPQAFHLKHHIRESVAKRYKLAKVVKEALVDRIENGDIGEWAWLIGVVLLGEDTDVKQAIRRRIREDRLFSPNKIISILGETMVLKGTESVIEIQEELSDGGYTIKCLYRGNIIAKVKTIRNDETNIPWLKNEMRTKLVDDIFEYFI